MAQTGIAQPASPAEARAIQSELRGKLEIRDRLGKVGTIAGVDVGYNKRDNKSRASVVVLNASTLEEIASAVATMPTTFPYVPGLLSFREIPVILKALEKLKIAPDLLMVDGHGIAHPRRMGIAAHLGLVTGLPSIGVAKSLLVGRYSEPGLRKGDISLLLDGAERVGTVLRSRDRVKPLFVSPGHRVSHETALRVVLECLTRYRLPEPTRLADKLSKFRAP